MPPEAKIITKNEDLPEFELGNNKKKSFFSRIMKKKEQAPQRPQSLEISEESKTDIPEVSEDDLNNIRKALGINEDNQSTIREEFEEKTATDSFMEKPEVEDDELKPPTMPSKIASQKTKPKTEKTKPEPISKLKKPKITTPDLTELILKHNKETPIKKPEIKVNPEKPLQKLEKDFEKNKNQLVKKVEKKDATVSHAKHQAKKHFEIYKKQIDKLAKTHAIQINKEKKTHETKLKKKAEMLEKKRLSLNAKELKLKEKEKLLSEKEAKINKQVADLEGYAKEISLLDKQLFKNKQEIEKQKAILSDLKSQLAVTKKAISEANQEQKQAEKEHEEYLKKIDLELARKKKDYDELERKSYNEKKILDSKRADIMKEQARLEKLIQDEKKVAEALNNRNYLPKRDEHIKVLEDHDDDWQKDYHEKYVAVQESPLDEIHEKIQDCRELLEEQKYDDAKYIYNDIRTEFLNSDFSDEDKILLKKEIKELYDEICLKILNK